MRGTARTRDVPIIFLTAGTPERGRIFRGYEAGAVDFLFKPLDAHLLQSKVGVFIQLFRQRQLLARQVEEHRHLVRTAELLVGVLGHDLRTPLGAILTAGETLRLAYGGDPRAAQLANVIRSASLRMRRLIDQLLDFASARLGTLPVRPQPADLGELCEVAMAELRNQGAQFVASMQGDTGGTWDPDRVAQLLSNLLGNAAQHGEPGAVVALRVDGEAPEAVAIEIENEGMLPEAVRVNLFAPFAHAPGQSGGTGLGLYIVDQIARAHGGHVSAECANGRTTFTVRLPRHCHAAGEAKASARARETAVD
jgi:signal transduction histidine kinase